MTDAPAPPPNISELVDILGVDGALLMIETYGGTELWVPTGVNNSSAKLRESLEEKFGKTKTRDLIRRFGGGKIQVPLCHEWRTALYRHRGLTQAEIARTLNCSAFTVYRRLKRLAADADQMKFQFVPLPNTRGEH